MRLILLSLLALAGYAAEDTPKLPPDVQAVIGKADAARVKIDQALIKDLTKLQETYTKKGNLDAANGIKAKIDEVTKGLPDPLADKPVAADPVGKWTVYNTAWTVGTITMNKDKTCLAGNGDKGTWSLQKSMLVIQWYNGNSNKGPLSKDIIMEGDKGASFSMKLNE